MKMKINKARGGLSSISVLPPQSQSRGSSGVSNRLESASIFRRSQTASQLRSQQSQQSLTQGVSSQHGLFSQFSPNSQEEVLTNEDLKKERTQQGACYLPLIESAREENQIIVSRTSNNLMCKWSSQEYKCHVNEELEHRIGTIETSLSRPGLILDSVQSDIMQAYKGTKELALETKDMRQKLNAHNDSLQLMLLSIKDLVLRGESMSLDEPIDSFPGRRAQILELVKFLGPLNSTMVPSFVYGGPSTGKTSTALHMFKHLKRPFIHGSFVSCYNPRMLFESILNQLLLHRKNEGSGYLSSRKCDFVKL